MARQVFINLAVRNLNKSMIFIGALGYTNNLNFRMTSKCMVWAKTFCDDYTHERFAHD